MEHINMRKFGMVMNVAMNVLIGGVMTASVLLLRHAFGFEAFLMGWVSGFAVGYTICDLIPVIPWAKQVSGSLQNGVARVLVNAVILAVVLTALMSFVNTFLGVGFGVFPIWIKSLPLSIAEVFCLILIVMPLIEKLAIRIATEQ